jgi:hypothetical protein
MPKNMDGNGIRKNGGKEIKILVTCPLQARILEPEKTSVVRYWLCKHVSTATKSRDRRNRYTRNKRGTVGGDVLCWVRAEAV